MIVATAIGHLRQLLAVVRPSFLFSIFESGFQAMQLQQLHSPARMLLLQKLEALRGRMTMMAAFHVRTDYVYKASRSSPLPRILCLQSAPARDSQRIPGICLGSWGLLLADAWSLKG